MAIHSFPFKVPNNKLLSKQRSLELRKYISHGLREFLSALTGDIYFVILLRTQIFYINDHVVSLIYLCVCVCPGGGGGANVKDLCLSSVLPGKLF